MIRAVIDTNVIVSSFLGDTGTPREIRRAWQHGLFKLCISQPLLEEVEGILRLSRIVKRVRAAEAEVEEFLELAIPSAACAIEPLVVKPVVPDDPDDDFIVATALATQADYIVSGDKHLLDLKEYQGIQIITPRQFLRVLSSS